MEFLKEIKSTINRPQLKAGLNVLFTGYWLDEKWRLFFKSHGLSFPQYNVLRILRGQKGNSINLQDLHSRMIRRNSNTTRLVEKLRLKGFVDRKPCKENRRKVDISITEEGLAMINGLDQPLLKRENEIYGGLSEDEAEILNDLLNKIRE